jgi:hypothetical protein
LVGHVGFIDIGAKENLISILFLNLSSSQTIEKHEQKFAELFPACNGL